MHFPDIYEVPVLLLQSFVFGIFSGLLYDILSFFQIKPSGKPITDGILRFFRDLFFYCILSVCICIFFYAANEGRIRLSALVLICFGALFYTRLISGSVKKIIFSIRKTILYILSLLIRYILKPALFILLLPTGKILKILRKKRLTKRTKSYISDIEEELKHGSYIMR